MASRHQRGRYDGDGPTPPEFEEGPPEGRMSRYWSEGAPSVAVPFYDNLEATPIDGLSCLVEVERVYGLDWDRFDERHWQDLARVYEGLPGAVRHRDVPWWFGDDEDMPPFLW